jgi:hypothetical protein
MERRIINLCLVACLCLFPGSSCENSHTPVTYTSITGLYSCQETSPHAGLRKYFVEIDQVRDHENLFIISNFHNKGENEFLFAELDQDTLVIFNQAISNISVNGKGEVGTDYRSISLFYETDDGVTSLDYNALYTR